MAWIESHQSLRNHPKTILLSKKLDISRAQAVGHLHFLWWWCCDYAPDGRLDRYTPDQIAEAAEWTGNAGLFLQHMADTGFIDRDPLCVHDWKSYRFHYDLSRARHDRKLTLVRRRVKRWRDRNAPSNAVGNAPVTLCNAAKEPNQTKPNHTNKILGIAASPPAYPLPDPKENPKACLVLTYKTRKGVAFDDRAWDKGNFGRGMKAAEVLLGLCKNLAAAEACLNDMGAEYDANGLTWTLETVARNAAEWLKKMGRTDGNASRAGLRMAIAERRAKEQGAGGLGKVAVGALPVAVRNGPAGKPDDEPHDQDRRRIIDEDDLG